MSARAEGIGSRRESRERALSLLYEAEAKGCDPLEDVLAQLVLEPEPFAADVVAGVSRHRAEIDALIGGVARGWALERMPVVDRNLLRMAVYELAHRPDVPTGAVISEAVELAKEYSTDDSGGFVNGVLSRLATELRTAGDPPLLRSKPEGPPGP